MANSASVAVLSQGLADQYNNLRADVLDPTTGHPHDGTASGGRKLKYSRQVVWMVAGTATSGANKSALVYWRGSSGSITKADAYAKTAPSGSDIIFDINLGGSTIWSTQSNRLRILASASSGSQGSFNTTTIVDGNYLGLDIDQIGSASAGADITVSLQIYSDVEGD